jgi:hypothetical protein
MTADMKNPSSGKSGDAPLFWVTRKGARIALIALHIAAVVSVVVELVRPFPADAHAVERTHMLDFLASYAIYGFVACVILVLMGRVLRRLVIRNENYYHGDE